MHQAESVVGSVDVTIGMNTSIGDKAAVIFASQFYSAISFGLSVQKAFQQVKAALMLEDIPEYSNGGVKNRISGGGNTRTLSLLFK